MPRVSAMPAPGPLTGLELVPALQGGGSNGNVGIPLLAQGSTPRGTVLKLRVPMTADMSDTAAANPGAHKVRWNDLPADATEIYINDADANGASLTAAMASLQPGGFVYLQGVELEDRDNWMKLQVDTIIDAVGYTTVAYTLIASGGAFAPDDDLELTIQQPSPLPGLDRRTVNVATIDGDGLLTFDHDAGDFHKVDVTADIDEIAIDNLPGEGVGIRLEILFVGDGTAHSWSPPAGWDFGDGVDAPSIPEEGRLSITLLSFDGGATFAATAHLWTP